ENEGNNDSTNIENLKNEDPSSNLTELPKVVGFDFDHNWDTVSYLYRESTAKDLHIRDKVNNFTLVARGNFSSVEINSYDILRVYTVGYICAPLSSNPYYKGWFNKIIPDYRIFATISLTLLRLHPNLKSQVEDYANNNFRDYNIEHYYEAVRMLMLEVKNKNVSIFVAADNTDGRNNLIIHSEDNMDLENPIMELNR
ncbi:5764_t:CDS:2, partial [Gigaspora rosea]